MEIQHQTFVCLQHIKIITLKLYCMFYSHLKLEIRRYSTMTAEMRGEDSLLNTLLPAMPKTRPCFLFPTLFPAGQAENPEILQNYCSDQKLFLAL